MVRQFKHIIFVVSLLNSLLSVAQNTDVVTRIETILESVVENLDEETDISVITEDLENLAENPLNINSATAGQLSRLHVLNDILIQKLIDYRKSYGQIYSLYELRSIDGFSPNLLQNIEPFIYFGTVTEESKSLSEIFRYGKNQLLLRSLGTTQKAAGYRQKDDGSIPYEGNRFRYYARYRFESGENISAGVTAEKDPGETFFSGSNSNGFDFYSGHISMKVSKIVRNVTIGDFHVRAGQGLVLWQGFTTGKSLNTIELSKTNQGIRPFTSTDENLFFRGIATTLGFGDFSVNLFFSDKKDDANLVFTDSVPVYFSSLQTSGYHRTVNEIADEKSIRNSNFGGVLKWNLRNFKIGATLHYQQFGLPYVRSDQLYNKFRFSGEENFTAGADYLFVKGKYQLFGEAAVSKSGGKAFVQGAVAHLHDQVSFSMLLRHFDKDYHALWANPFAEGSSANNESGLYFGTKIFPLKYVTLSAYSDFYQSSWLSYTTAAPSLGNDIFVQADFYLSKKLEFYLRFKNEEKEQKTTSGERYINILEKTTKSRIHFQYTPTETITLKTRVENSFFKGIDKEKGFLVFQDFQFAPKSFPFNFTARLAWFKTDGYDSRIYVYENDLLYTFSVPAYFGKGLRTYVNLKYNISKNLDFWLKLGNTRYNNVESISSGYNEIAGNNKTEIKFQLRLKI